jgi:uncharacterized protein
MDRPALAIATRLAVSVALTLALLGIAARGARAVPPAETEARIRLEVAGVLPAPDGGSILILREKGAETILPVIVPGADGRDLRRRLDGERPPGVLGEALAALGARVREVEIAEADDSVVGARIRISQGARDVELEARPSESVVLAVAAGAPILTTRRLLDTSGLTPEDLARARDRVAAEHAGETRL